MDEVIGQFRRPEFGFPCDVRRVLFDL